MDIKRMIMYIQIYIHHLKGVEVHVTPDFPRELPELRQAHRIAKDWCDLNII